jgi:hypothetical protein
MAIATGVFETAERIIVPGVLIDNGEEALERRQQAGFGDLAPTLRLLSPFGDTTALIRILRPNQGDVLSEVGLTEGRVVDIALDEIGSGLFSIIIDSDAPLVGGARVSVVGADSTDVSWVGAHPVLEEPTYFALPFGPEATLSLVAPDEAVEVTVGRLSADATRVVGQTTVRVGAGETVSRLLGVAGGGYLIETTGPIVATALVRLEAGVGHVATAPTPPGNPPVAIIAREEKP